MIRAGSMRVVSAALFTLALSALAIPVKAHEFWISARDGTLAPGDTIVGDLKVGTDLRGVPYPYLPDRFRSSTCIVIPAFNEAPGIGDVVRSLMCADVAWYS